MIRKIFVGPDYMRSMTYTCGQKILSGKYEIHSIRRRSADQFVEIIIKNDSTLEVRIWKEFTPSVPISFEYDVNFSENASDK